MYSNIVVGVYQGWLRERRGLIDLADITPLKTRGMWQGFIGGTWGIASVLGPIFGGLLTERVSWYVPYNCLAILVDRANDTGVGCFVRPMNTIMYDIKAELPDINLPTGGIAFACLFFTLKLNPTRRSTFAQFKQTFDFVGL